MNGWNLLIIVAFILYLGVEYYFWRRERQQRKEEHDNDNETTSGL
jgi:preprotein translocase subunit YajC